MAKDFSSKSAEVIQSSDGTQYHIGLKAGDVAPYILMCGDVERVDKVAAFLDSPSKPFRSREYITITGKYKGVPISVMATGMGPDNTEIAIVELSQIVKNPTLIRIGTCGGLQKKCGLGDVVISSGAVRLENTSTFFVHPGFPALAHHEVIVALMAAASQQKADYHVGLTATASGFYGAQGRTTPIFKPLDSELPATLAKQNVLNLEMEAACLFTLSSLVGYRAGAICVVVANRLINTFIDDATKKKSEMKCIEVGLQAVLNLAKMDREKGKASHWVPRL